MILKIQFLKGKIDENLHHSIKGKHKITYLEKAI